MQVREIKGLIKECVLEVLQETLLEGFDPLSQGPNVIDPSGDANPYPAWNAKMRTLEENDEPIKLTRVGDDDWSRPVYTDEHGRQYVDVNMGRGNPSIHTTTAKGEPELPVRNYTIVSDSPKPRFPNALCPRCKTSKPEHIITHPNGEKQCKSCNCQWAKWEDELIENEHGRYAQEAGAGQFDPRTFGKLNDIICQRCNHKFDYNTVSEVSMGLVRCPNCKTKIDQTGTGFGKI